MRMPRGKFQGEELEQIPSDYLFWVSTDWDEPYATEADKEYREREQCGEHFYKVLRRNL